MSHTTACTQATLQLCTWFEGENIKALEGERKKPNPIQQHTLPAHLPYTRWKKILSGANPLKYVYTLLTPRLRSLGRCFWKELKSSQYSPYVSQKIPSNGPMSDRTSCHRPKTTRTLGLSAQPSRSMRAWISGCASTIVWERGLCFCISSSTIPVLACMGNGQPL